MPTPYESARLNLQLFEMRREPVLREARLWFTRQAAGCGARRGRGTTRISAAVALRKRSP